VEHRPSHLKITTAKERTVCGTLKELRRLGDVACDALRRVLLPTKQPIKHFHIFLVGFDVFDLAHVVGEGAGGSLDAREQAEE
jgi:hypothetical protein